MSTQVENKGITQPPQAPATQQGCFRGKTVALWQTPLGLALIFIGVASITVAAYTLGQNQGWLPKNPWINPSPTQTAILLGTSAIVGIALVAIGIYYIAKRDTDETGKKEDVKNKQPDLVLEMIANFEINNTKTERKGQQYYHCRLTTAEGIAKEIYLNEKEVSKFVSELAKDKVTNKTENEFKLTAEPALNTYHILGNFETLKMVRDRIFA